jgi:hypothetical protein
MESSRAVPIPLVQRILLVTAVSAAYIVVIIQGETVSSTLKNSEAFIPFDSGCHLLSRIEVLAYSHSSSKDEIWKPNSWDSVAAESGVKNDYCRTDRLIRQALSHRWGEFRQASEEPNCPRWDL